MPEREFGNIRCLMFHAERKSPCPVITTKQMESQILCRRSDSVIGGFPKHRNCVRFRLFLFQPVLLKALVNPLFLLSYTCTLCGFHCCQLTFYFLYDRR